MTGPIAPLFLSLDKYDEQREKITTHIFVILFWFVRSHIFGCAGLFVLLSVFFPVVSHRWSFFCGAIKIKSLGKLLKAHKYEARDSEKKKKETNRVFSPSHLKSTVATPPHKRTGCFFSLHLMSQSNICVGIRARPLLDHQRERRAPGLEIRGNRILTGTKVFDPDIVFSEEASQSSIVDSCVPVFESVANGRNGTIMVYGQTGTGKTHTMFGGLHDSAFSSQPATTAAPVGGGHQQPVVGGGPTNAHYASSTLGTTCIGGSPLLPLGGGDPASSSGIVYSAIEYLLERVRCKTRNGIAASLSISIIEIYNEKITDMLPMTIAAPSAHHASSSSADQIGAAPTTVLLSTTSEERLDEVGVPADHDELATTFSHDEEESCPSEVALPPSAGPRRITTTTPVLSLPKSEPKAYNFKEGGILLVNGAPRNNRSIVVTSVEDAVYIVRKALSRRHVSPTAMNDRSSRSHVIVMLTHDERVTETVTETSHLYLIDLAGSECLKKSLATGKAAAEAGMINKSLHALRNVITALTSQQQHAQVGGSGGGAVGGNGLGVALASSSRVHIPYRDSKLTELLQDSVGGTAKTMLIACISLVARDLEETKMTLEYATKARKIRNNPTADEREKLLLRVRSLEYQLQQALNKTPGSVTISREFYEDLMQLHARLEEATENTEKLSTMLVRAESNQRIERYQQEENARAIRVAEEERVRCVSYLVQQVARLNDVKTQLTASFQSMHHTVLEASEGWHHTTDTVLRSLEHKIMCEGSGDHARPSESNLKIQQQQSSGVPIKSPGELFLMAQCPNSTAQLQAVVRQVQGGVDALVSDILEHTTHFEVRLRELAVEAAKGVRAEVQAAEAKLMEACAILTKTHKRVDTWAVEHTELAAGQTAWVKALHDRDPIVTIDTLLPLSSELRIETIRGIRSHLSDAAMGGAPSSYASSVNVPQRHPKATRSTGVIEASNAAPSQHNEEAVDGVAAPSTPTTLLAAVEKVRALWSTSSRQMNMWKHETLSGAPAAVIDVQQQELSGAPPVVIVGSPAAHTFSSKQAATAECVSVSPSPGMIAPVALPNPSMVGKGASAAAAPPLATSSSTALRPSSLRNSSAMATAAAAADARKRPRSNSAVIALPPSGTSNTAARSPIGARHRLPAAQKE